MFRIRHLLLFCLLFERAIFLLCIYLIAPREFGLVRLPLRFYEFVALTTIVCRQNYEESGAFVAYWIVNGYQPPVKC